MKYALFPGCVLDGAAAEAYTSLKEVCAKLDIEITEIPNWTCCGASHAQGVNDLAALAVNARSISIAEHMEMPILTVCNTCTLQLRTAKYRLDHDAALKEKVNSILKKAGHPYEYQGTSEITHFLWVLDEHPEVLDGKVTNELKGTQVACYYGCHILRPAPVMNHESGDYPESFERLVRRLGAEPVWFDAGRKCCGFHAQFTAEHDVLTVTGQIAASADRAGADLIATPCPLCQMQLDMYGPEGREAVKSQTEMPVLHLQQLVGLALGMTRDEVGFNRHVSAREKLKIGS
ncbi:heterodisulfide reductase subunit B [Selenomonas sp. oral taxon 920]|uniref:CoB--CoM heterodisulfide reductase iron-sulfur subunit B family protein n=1 Tax=Selenomonas sp. oral taxon 920 TaxID=1884263 RepID=UPI000840DCD8|nr:CoB--CoM heterodisulfide reductase iron-sulfur subunit B family protein [Selenomonas sp. oral taxon 920]AOH48726.1 heterodisulfide reductase subunit B [Selenomonas sp. oral taxon 920]